MNKHTSTDFTAGLDVGDRVSQVCILNDEGDVVESRRIETTQRSLVRALQEWGPMRVALEVGAHSPWISDCLKAEGHEVIVANARDIERITKDHRKNDRNDAELLARLARVDVKLLSPIEHRPVELRGDLAVIRARDALVRTRTLLINSVRGLLKSHGIRIPKCSTEAFHKRAVEHVPAALSQAVFGTIRVVGELTNEIRRYDKTVVELAEKKYPASSLLQEVPGVGALTALAFMLTIGDPKRFQKSRHVGPYFGLTRKQQQSSSGDPELRISKAGNSFVRHLLVGSAQFILGPFGPDTDLRRWGLSLAGTSKKTKKRAVVAVARKLAVLLHHLWITAEVYRPLRQAPEPMKPAEPPAQAPVPGEPPVLAAHAVAPIASLPLGEGRRRGRRSQGRERHSVSTDTRPAASHATPSVPVTNATPRTMPAAAPRGPAAAR